MDFNNVANESSDDYKRNNNSENHRYKPEYEYSELGSEQQYEQQSEDKFVRERRSGIIRNNIFGRKLKMLRKSKGLNQKDLSDKLNVNSQTISRWERGEDIPKINAVQAVAATLDVPFDFLLDGGITDPETSRYKDTYRLSGKTYPWKNTIWENACEVLRIFPPINKVKLLDVGCGEGESSVFFSRNGYEVTAFDMMNSAVKKARLLAFNNNVNIEFFQANLLSFNLLEDRGVFDVIYGHKVLDYIPLKYRKRVINLFKEHTAVGGINVFDVCVEKSFVENPPERQSDKQFYWQTGELFSHYRKDWKLEKIQEVELTCALTAESETPCKYFSDVIIARKMR